MSDYYTEQLVKKRADMKDVFIKALLVALTIVSVLIVFLFPFGIILPVGMIVLDVFMFRRMNVEYEYLYVNGDLDIDKIMNKAKRKRVFSAHVSGRKAIRFQLEERRGAPLRLGRHRQGTEEESDI